MLRCGRAGALARDGCGCMFEHSGEKGEPANCMSGPLLLQIIGAGRYKLDRAQRLSA